MYDISQPVARVSSVCRPIMTAEGRFSFSEIFDYLKSGKYPDGFNKNDKRALRKRTEFFDLKETKLYYKNG